MFDPTAVSPTDAFAVGLLAGLLLAALFALALWGLVALSDELRGWELRVEWRRK